MAYVHIGMLQVCSPVNPIHCSPFLPPLTVELPPMILLPIRRSYRAFFLVMAVSLFGFLVPTFTATAEAALCDGTATPCVEDPAIDNCVQCHSIKVQGGNRNGTDRFLTVSSSTNRHILGPRQSDWTADVSGMISKGAPGDTTKAAKTSAYLNTNYCTTCTGPILSSATISGITSTAAKVEWTTSGSGFGDLAATSCVIYGTSTTSMTGDTCNSADPNYDPNGASLVTTHSVSLTGLTPLTKHYVVHRSSAGGLTTSYTLAASFTTPPSGGGGGGGGGALGTIVSLAVGDFNNDAKLDLGVGVSTKNHVISYLGNGTGGFTKGQTLANVGTTPTSITSGGVKGDFNGDGRDDLAAANFGSKNVAVFLGTVASGFQTTAVSSLSVADPPTAVAAGDFSGDGRLDLAVATVMSDGSRGFVLLFTGNGTGQFTGPLTTLDVEVSTAVGPTISSITPNTLDCVGLPGDITITGTLLLEGLTVSLDGTLPLTVKSVSADSTTVVATVPSTATSGVHSVVVTVSGLPPASGNLTIAPRVISITSVNPSSRTYGAAGGQIWIYGENFIAGGTLKIGNVSGTTVTGSSATAATPFVFVNSREVRAYLDGAALPVGSYEVSYANPDGCAGVAYLANAFTVTAPQPILSPPLSPSEVFYGLTPSGSVTLWGDNFVMGATMTIGGLSGTTVTGTTATATTPFVFVNKTQLKFYWDNRSLPLGAYAIAVTNPPSAGSLTGSLTNAFTVKAPQPIVSSVTPTSVIYDVSASQSVSVYGANFLSGATITVGGVSGTTVTGTDATASTPFVWLNSGQLKFFWNRTSLLPGVYDVQVTNPSASGSLMGTLAGGFTVSGAQPSVTSVSPTPVTYAVTASSSITIYGDNFVVGGTITVGSLSGATVASTATAATATTPFIFVNKTQLKFYWPNTALPPGTHDVQVTNTAASGGLSTTSVGAFTVTAPQPTVTNLSPAQLTYGLSASTGITIFGSNFVVGATITLGGLSGTTVAGSVASVTTRYVFVNNSQLTFYWPNTSLPPGVYTLNIVNPAAAGGLGTVKTDAFTVVAPQPGVSSASPSPVTYGVSASSSITVWGSGFIQGATITVGSLSGATVAGSTASATMPFVFVNNSQLKFYWNNTGLPTGSYTIAVSNPSSAGGLSASLTNGFVVQAPQPAVTTVTPASVTYGVSPSGEVTVWGSGFVQGATMTVGSLSGTTVAGSSASAGTPFVYVNSGQLKFYWSNTSLAVAAHAITVTNPVTAGGLSGTLANAFTVAAAQPTLSSVLPSPVTYEVTASSSVTIYGSGFVLGATITVGSLSGTIVSGSNATSGTPFVFVNSTQLKFYWPNTSLAVGSYAVTVANPAAAGGLATTLAGGFVVAAAQPALSSLLPSTVTYGVTASGSVTIYGSGFVLGSTITVGSLSGATVAGSSATSGTPFVYVSSTQLKFYWPNTSLPIGSYNVGVTNTAPAGGLTGSLANGFVVQ
ncbi:MAG: VCBS repeat-containing protein [Nitrospiria bacterium]